MIKSMEYSLNNFIGLIILLFFCLCLLIYKYRQDKRLKTFEERSALSMVLSGRVYMICIIGIIFVIVQLIRWCS